MAAESGTGTASTCSNCPTSSGAAAESDFEFTDGESCDCSTSEVVSTPILDKL